jgi:hypothetical protein
VARLITGTGWQPEIIVGSEAEFSSAITKLSYYTFTVTSSNATVGATYTNNLETFTVLYTISGGTTLVCSGTGVPSASGTLTKVTGTGDAAIVFSSTFTGGEIVINRDFAISSPYTILKDIRISGYGPSSRISLNGSGALTMATDTEIRDLCIITNRTTGSLVSVTGSRVVISRSTFIVNPATTVTCVYLTASGTRILSTKFQGVASLGATAIGINDAIGTNNVNRDCSFL